jgi:hypothetical protein
MHPGLAGSSGFALDCHPRLASEHPMPSQGRYRSFCEFYPFYISEHTNRTSRRLHVTGTGLAITLLIAALALRDWRFIPAAVVCGYGFAWIGHTAFEKNRPATFTYPLWSLLGDFRLFWETVTARRPW